MRCIALWSGAVYRHFSFPHPDLLPEGEGGAEPNITSQDLAAPFHPNLYHSFDLTRQYRF